MEVLVKCCFGGCEECIDGGVGFVLDGVDVNDEIEFLLVIFGWGFDGGGSVGMSAWATE